MRKIIVSAIVLGLLGGCPSGGTKSEPGAPAEGEAGKKKRGGKKKQPPAEEPAQEEPAEGGDSDAEE